MFWRKFLVLSLLFIWVSSGQAAPLPKAAAGITPARQFALNVRLKNLLATQEARIGVSVVDLQSGWHFSFNGSAELPAASVAKVPVMAAAFCLADNDRLDLQQKISFKESDKLEGAGVLRWIKAGQQYTLWNLIRLMITLSDNTATRLVVKTVGLKEIDQYLKNNNFNNIRISDPTMLIEPPATNNNLASADDLARQLALIYNCRGFSKKSAKQMIAWMNYQRYRWGIWRGVPSGTYVANKTGHLTGILNDIGLVYTKQGVYALAILTDGFTSKGRARQLINEVSRITYEEYTGEKVVRSKTPVSKKKVTKQRSPRRPSVKSRPR